VAERSPILADRFAAGDALRGIAALMVLTTHVASGTVLLGDAPLTADVVYGERAGPLLVHGLTAGLYLFFPLSGFVLARPFLRAGRDARVGRYLRNRALRLVPALWVLTAFMLLRHGTFGASWHEVLAVPLFLQSFDWSPFADRSFHVWTLGVEALFYLLVPLIVLVRRWRAPLLLAALAVVYVAGIRYQAAGPPDDLARRTVGTLIYAMLPGIAFAVVEPHVRPRVWGAARPGRIAGVALLVYAVVAFYWLVYRDPGPGAELVLRSTSTAAVVAAAILHEWVHGRPHRVFEVGPVRWLGERSYGFYLWHVAVGLEVFDVVGRVEPSWGTFLALWVVCLAATAPVAHVSFRVVEAPFLRRRAVWQEGGAARRSPRTRRARARYKRRAPT